MLWTACQRRDTIIVWKGSHERLCKDSAKPFLQVDDNDRLQTSVRELPLYFYAQKAHHQASIDPERSLSATMVIPGSALVSHTKARL